MKRTAIALLSAPAIVLAQWNVPPESQRCPSKWGAGCASLTGGAAF